MSLTSDEKLMVISTPWKSRYLIPVSWMKIKPTRKKKVRKAQMSGK